MTKQLRDRFQSSSSDIQLRSEDIQKLETQLAGLADKVKSGDYIVKATAHTDQSFIVTITPSASNTAASIKSMEFKFTPNNEGLTDVFYRIKTAAGKSFIDAGGGWGEDLGGLRGFVKMAYMLGLEKVASNERAADQKKRAGIDDIKL